MLQYGGLATVSFIAADVAKTTIAGLKKDKAKFGTGLKRIPTASNRFVQKIIAAEVTGWIPVVGDVAGVMFTIAAFVEMCETYKHIELTYGVPMYTDSSCETAHDLWDKYKINKNKPLQTSQTVI
jgi:hypothetical protein